MVFPSLFSTYLIHLFSSLTMPSNAHWPWMQGESLRIILFWSLMGWYACKFLILNDITCEKWMKWTDNRFFVWKVIWFVSKIWTALCCNLFDKSYHFPYLFFNMFILFYLVYSGQTQPWTSQDHTWGSD